VPRIVLVVYILAGALAVILCAVLMVAVMVERQA
jgi:hypothetical protein